jgi:hypothetical protein
MPDRTSSYRAVKLHLYPSPTESDQAVWALVLETVRKGIPHASVVERGAVSMPHGTPTIAEIWECIHDVAGCLSGVQDDELDDDPL